MLKRVFGALAACALLASCGETITIQVPSGGTGGSSTSAPRGYERLLAQARYEILCGSKTDMRA